MRSLKLIHSPSCCSQLPGRGCGSESHTANERVNEVPAVERRALRGALKAYPVVLKTEMVHGSWFYLFIYSLAIQCKIPVQKKNSAREMHMTEKWEDCNPVGV